MKKEYHIISCTKEEFVRIKSDKRFLNLIILARFINALRFCQKPILEFEDNSQRCSDGTRLNSFIFASSVLYEGFKLIDKLRKDNNINNFKSFKNGFEPLINDPFIKDFRNSILTRIRNQIVFHFDSRMVKISLKKFDLPNIKFALRCKKNSETYFGLADEIAMNYVLQPKENESNESLMDRFDQIVRDTCTIMDRFNKAAIMLMAEVMEDMPFKKS